MNMPVIYVGTEDTVTGVLFLAIALVISIKVSMAIWKERKRNAKDRK